MDLPFALPTSVAGLTLATVYGDEFIIGQFLQSLGIQVSALLTSCRHEGPAHGANRQAYCTASTTQRAAVTLVALNATTS